MTTDGSVDTRPLPCGHPYTELVHTENGRYYCKSCTKKNAETVERLSRIAEETSDRCRVWAERKLRTLREQRQVALKEDFTIGPRGRCGCGTLLPQGETVCGMCCRY